MTRTIARLVASLLLVGGIAVAATPAHAAVGAVGSTPIVSIDGGFEWTT